MISADDVECMLILHRIQLYFFRVAVEEMIVSMSDFGKSIKENLE